jgi:hypothetical protein
MRHREVAAMKLFATIIGLLVGFLALVTSPVDAQVYSADAIGMHPAWNVNSNVNDDTGDLLNDMGVGWVRVSFYWNDVENTNDGWNSTLLQNYSNWVDDFQEKGIKVLGVIGQTPSWADEPGDNYPVDRRAPADGQIDEFGEFVDKLADYVGDVDAIEVWNQAFSEGVSSLSSTDTTQHFAGSSADGYLLLDMVDTVAAHFGSATVVCCGFTSDNGDSSFVDLFADSVSDNLDVISLHSHGLDHDEPQDWAQHVVDDGVTQDIWNTEFGPPCCSTISPGAHWAAIETAFDDLGTPSAFKKAFYYTFDINNAGDQQFAEHSATSPYHPADEVEYEPFCELVRAAGNVEDTDWCTDDLSLSPTFVKPGSTCTYTATGPAHFDEDIPNDFYWQTTEPMSGHTDGDNQVSIEAGTNGFYVTVSTGGYVEQFYVTVSSAAPICTGAAQEQ